MPHLPGSPESDSVCLVWVDERTSLRDLKKAIGSKTVFKYRLQFYPSIEKYYASLPKDSDVNFSTEQKALITEMSTREQIRNAYRRSA